MLLDKKIVNTVPESEKRKNKVNNSVCARCQSIMFRLYYIYNIYIIQYTYIVGKYNIYLYEL